MSEGCLVFTNDEEWWIANDREVLRTWLEEMIGPEETAEVSEAMRIMDADEELKIAWERSVLPEWAHDSALRIEPCEPFGDGWDCRVIGPVWAFAKLAEPGLLGSIHY